MHVFTTRALGLLAALGAATLYVLVALAVVVQLVPSQPHLTRRYVPFNAHASSVELPAGDGRSELAPKLHARAGASVAEILDTVPGIEGPQWVGPSAGLIERRTSIGHRWLLWDQLRGRAPPLRDLSRS